MAINAANVKLQSDGQLTDHEKWLRAPAEQHLGMWSNAYSEIEIRAKAMYEMRKSDLAQQEGEPTARRWAREDAATLPHVREKEREIALDAVARSMAANKTYASTMTGEFPEIATSAEQVSKARSAPKIAVVLGKGALQVEVPSGNILITSSVPPEHEQLAEQIDRFDVAELSAWFEKVSGRDEIVGEEVELPTIGYWKKDGGYVTPSEEFRAEAEAELGSRRSSHP